MQDAFWNVLRRIATKKRRSGARRGDEIPLDDVLPPFHEDGRQASETRPQHRFNALED